MSNLTVIRLSENALCSIVMSGVEAYVEKNLNFARPRNQLEIHGLLFGSESKLKEGTRVLQVEMANVTSTSQQTGNSVGYSLTSVALKSDIAQAFFPHLSFLGDFHTHPFRHFGEVSKIKGFYLSKTDRQSLKNDQTVMKSLNYRLGMVAAIAFTRKRTNPSASYADSEGNTILFNMGNFKIWISVYITVIDENGDLSYSCDNCADVILHVPALNGLHMFSDIGILKHGKRSIRYCPPMETMFSAEK